MLPYLLPAAVAVAAAVTLTPVVRILAIRWRFVDLPDGSRKLHVRAVALGGGVAVLLAAFVGISTIAFSDRAAALLIDANEAALNWLGLVAAALLLCLVGIYDDRRPLAGKYKLLWQMLASSLVIGSGLVIDRVAIFGATLDLGLLGVLLTMVWLLAAINSLNLIDGVDGLAASVALIFSSALGMMALFQGQMFVGAVSFSIAGGLIGFLPFNLPTAKIYLGDAGSMALGLVLGTLAVECSFKEAATVAFAAPLALWAIPVFDSVVALARRKLTGRSMYAFDRGHIHHRLLLCGLRPWQTLAIVAGLCLLTSAGAVASIYFQNQWLGIAVAMFVIVALVATRVFGHVELVLLNNALVGLGHSWIPFTNNAAVARHNSVRLQGTLAWETLWEALVESAEQFGLHRIVLHVHAPQLHEDFYATWEHSHSPAPSSAWHMGVPLNIQGKAAGRVDVVGKPTWGNVTDQLQEFLDYVEMLQSKVARLVESEADPAKRIAGAITQSDAFESTAEPVSSAGA